jgi:lipopolysaccharide/colanic/teichoic acid biosynthesis glycosyltransferase
MTSGTQLPAAIEGQQKPAGSVTEDKDLKAFDETPCWPVTRLMGWSLTLMVGAAILLPTAIADAREVHWSVLLLPAAMATLGARALFETLSFSRASHRVGRHVAAAVLPALLATAVMEGASAVVTGRVSATAAAVTSVLAVTTLTTAGASRDVELRVRLSLRRVFFVGSGESRADLARELSRRQDAQLVGAVAADQSVGAASLTDEVLASKATVLVLDAHAMRIPELVDIAARLNLAGLHIRDLVSYYEFEFKKVPLAELAPTWFLFDIAGIHRRGVYLAVRRGFELALAGGLLLVSLPLLCLAALAIKLTSRGPVLYRQVRVGKGSDHFTLLKLRTMSHNTKAAGAWASADINRITPVGRRLRRFRLDELPQLWNVIRGDLALVGPRPEQVPIAEKLGRELAHYSARHCVRPGITGWAQVNLGYGGSPEGTIAKLQRDLYYIKHSNWRLDGLILWLTIKAMIAGRG